MLCTWMLLQHKKRQGTLFHKFPRDVSLREKWGNSIQRKDFIPGEQHVNAHSIFMVLKNKAVQTCLLYFHCFLSPNRESLQKIRLQLESPARRKKIGTGKSKALPDAVGEEVDFCVDLSDPLRRKELT